MTQIRKATVDDVPALTRMVAAYWEFDDIPGFDAVRVAQQLRRLLSQPALGAGWIAFQGGVPVGYLLGVYVFSLEHFGLTAEIDELFVSPDARDAGLGSQLITLAQAEFARAGCTNVFLQLSRQNETARRFYRRHGFGERSGYELLDKRL